MSSLGLALTQASPSPATVVNKGVSIASDHEVALLMLATLELTTQTTEIFREADKNLRLAKRQYKKGIGQHLRFTPIFLVGDYL